MFPTCHTARSRSTAGVLSIGRTTMYSLVSTGAIESVTIGRLRRVPSECLEKYVSSLRTSGQPESAAA
ncbi:MAG: helix-turn-helix domain-containing protein [Streptosporangiaceae bacterium]